MPKLESLSSFFDGEELKKGNLLKNSSSPLTNRQFLDLCRGREKYNLSWKKVTNFISVLFSVSISADSVRHKYKRINEHVFSMGGSKKQLQKDFFLNSNFEICVFDSSIQHENNGALTHVPSTLENSEHEDVLYLQDMEALSESNLNFVKNWKA